MRFFAPAGYCARRGFLVYYPPSCDCLRRLSLPRVLEIRAFGVPCRDHWQGLLPGTQNKEKEIDKMKIDKAAIKSEFQRHDRDTGSSEVQIAILTKEIEALTAHLKANKKDHSSRYGLLRKVQNRRSLLDYLKRENEASYKELIKKLGIRR